MFQLLNLQSHISIILLAQKDSKSSMWFQIQQVFFTDIQFCLDPRILQNIFFVCCEGVATYQPYIQTYSDTLTAETTKPIVTSHSFLIKFQLKIN